MICRHSAIVAERLDQHPRRAGPSAATFGATAKKAVTGVGAPS